MIGRRQMIAGAVSSIGCLCGHSAFAQAGWPKGGRAYDATRTAGGTGVPTAKVPVGGCALTSNGLRKFASQYRIADEIIYETGDTAKERFADRMNGYFLDFCLAAEEHLQVKPKFGFYDDGKDTNAFATPYQLFDDAKHPDGTVLFGYAMLDGQLAIGDNARSALMVIVAHEYAHIRQFKNERNGRCPFVELEADYLAGWVLGREEADRNGYKSDPSTVAQTMFSLGDYQFKNPDTHGTPEQRMNAVITGYQDGMRETGLELAYAKSHGTNWQT